MPYACPTCREANARIWVVEDLVEPFGCTGCVRKRGMEAVEVPLVAREAWPDTEKGELARRITLALSEDSKPPGAATGMTRAAASVALVEAAARLLGRRRHEPPADP